MSPAAYFSVRCPNLKNRGPRPADRHSASVRSASPSRAVASAGEYSACSISGPIVVAAVLLAVAMRALVLGIQIDVECVVEVPAAVAGPTPFRVIPGSTDL